MSILMFFKEMPKIKKRRNVGFVNLRNFKGFRRENSEGEIAQTDQISELRDIPIEIRPDSALDTGYYIFIVIFLTELVMSQNLRKFWEPNCTPLIINTFYSYK